MRHSTEINIYNLLPLAFAFLNQTSSDSIQSYLFLHKKQLSVKDFAKYRKKTMYFWGKF